MYRPVIKSFNNIPVFLSYFSEPQRDWPWVLFCQKDGADISPSGKNHQQGLLGNSKKYFAKRNGSRCFDKSNQYILPLQRNCAKLIMKSVNTKCNIVLQCYGQNLSEIAYVFFPRPNWFLRNWIKVNIISYRLKITYCL